MLKTFLKIFLFLQYLAIIKCNAISSIKVENAEFTLECSALVSQKISTFMVVNNGDMNCFDEHLFVTFDLIDIKTNRTLAMQGYLTKDGCCLVDRQVTRFFSLNILMKIFKELFECYLSFKQYVNEVKQARNRLRRN